MNGRIMRYLEDVGAKSNCSKLSYLSLHAFVVVLSTTVIQYSLNFIYRTFVCFQLNSGPPHKKYWLKKDLYPKSS